MSGRPSRIALALSALPGAVALRAAARRIVLAAVVGGIAALVAGAATAGADGGTPLGPDQLHLAAGPVQGTCVETGTNGTFGCHEGAESHYNPTLTLSTAPDGSALLVMSSRFDPSFPFSVARSGAGLVLSAPSLSTVNGTVLYAALTMQGDGVRFAGSTTVHNVTFNVTDRLDYTLALPGTGLTVAAPQRPTSTARASAPIPLGSPVAPGPGVPIVPVAVTAAVIAAAAASGVAWARRTQVPGVERQSPTWVRDSSTPSRETFAPPKPTDAPGMFAKFQPGIDAVVEQLNATGSSSLSALAQQFVQLQAQINLFEDGARGSAGTPSVAGLQFAVDAIQIPATGDAPGPMKPDQVQAVKNAQQVLEAILQPLYQLQQASPAQGDMGGEWGSAPPNVDKASTTDSGAAPGG